jgi:PPM family protein phosphatase
MQVERPHSPAVEYAERSDPGRDPDKQVNEDACGHRETRFGHLCVVCDGMGGHAAGREAAELALATILETFDGADDGEPPAEVLRTAIELASRRVYTMRTSEVALGRPGSTVVAVLLHAHGTEVVHVGDSRAYLVHEGQVSRLTHDHSIVQELVDRGLLTLQQAAHHPEANRITRALGMAEDVEAELRPQPVLHVTGDAFVLCSDGLCDLVEDAEILGIVGSQPAAQAVGKLVDLANARGGHDNITVIVLRAREPAMATGNGLAPTVAQPEPTLPLPDASKSTPTRVEVPLHEALKPGRSLVPTPPPPLSSRSAPPSRRTSPAVLAGLGLAVVACALLAALLYDEITERRGKRNATTGPPGFDLPLVDAARGATTSLAPEAVSLPAATAPSESIAPLDPAPPPAKRHKRAE